MTSIVARAHGNKSNRASTAKATLVEQKNIFKSVLGNPFEVGWPSVPSDVANSVLAQVVSLTEGVAQYHLSREAESRRRRRKRQAAASANTSLHPKKRIKSPSSFVLQDESSTDTDNYSMFNPPLGDTTDAGSPKPRLPMLQADRGKASALPILEHICIGINEVTKRLEAQARATRSVVTITSNTSPPTEDHAALTKPISVVFVCRDDVDPPLLIAHIPALVAACNYIRRGSVADGDAPYVKLVPLPKGSETTLTEALGLRHLAAIAFERAAPGIDVLLAYLEAVQTVAAPWLFPSTIEVVSTKTLELTHVKQLRTSAPKDVKAAKERRIKARAEAKAIQAHRVRKRGSVKITTVT